MVDVTAGAWLAYQLTVTDSGKLKSEPMVEKYSFDSVEDGKCKVTVERNGQPLGTMETLVTYGSALFDFSKLTKKGSDNINTAFGHFYANIYEGVVDGKSVRMYLGKDDIVFRYITTERSEAGLHSETRELCLASIKI
ncbi:MAG: hypothetical protein J5897_04950 [Candidatus Methanomethylophilus sp.]|nr:hypothetical protein [Methanomethylophilus sp.]